MKYVMVGTVGASGSGKSALVHALAGGKDFLRLPDGTLAGIVDTQELRGVDVVLIVMAADSDVAVQGNLVRLAVRFSAVALTKMDAVEKPQADAKEAALRTLLQGTFLENAPIIRVSAKTGKGIDALRRNLFAAVSRTSGPNVRLPFHLFVEAVTENSETGATVTGILTAGTLRIGDAVEIVPHKSTARVRGLHVYGEKKREAFAGCRVTVRLAENDAELAGAAEIVQPGLRAVGLQNESDTAHRIVNLLLGSPVGLPFAEIAEECELSEAETEAQINVLIGARQAEVLPGERVVLSVHLAYLADRARLALASYHAQFPQRPGMPKDELRAALGSTVDTRTMSSLLSHWQAKKMLLVEAGSVKLPDFVVELTMKQAALLERIAAFYVLCGIKSPPLAEVCREIQAPPDAVNALLRVGLERGRFVRIADDVYYDVSTLAALQDLVRAAVAQQGSLTVAAFRDLTHSNRETALHVLEYFDRIGFTQRSGDERTFPTE